MLAFYRADVAPAADAFAAGPSKLPRAHQTRSTVFSVPTDRVPALMAPEVESDVSRYADPRADAVRARYTAMSWPGDPSSAESIAEDMLRAARRAVARAGTSGMLLPTQRRILLNVQETHGETPICATASPSRTRSATGPATTKRLGCAQPAPSYCRAI